MLLSSKELTRFGALIAFSVILIVLSGIFEWNTLFFLTLASFGVGIVIRETSLKKGGIYLIAALVTALLLAPNKVYALTFSVISVYLFLCDTLYEWIGTNNRILQKNQIFRLSLVLVTIIYSLMLVFLGNGLLASLSLASPLQQTQQLIENYSPNLPVLLLSLALSGTLSLFFIIVYIAEIAFHQNFWNRMRKYIWDRTV